MNDFEENEICLDCECELDCGFENECGCGSTCKTESTLCTGISLPVKVKPYAKVGKIETQCMGEPDVNVRSFQGSNCSCGCEFTVTQEVCYHVPVEYGAKVETGEIIVDCRSVDC